MTTITDKERAIIDAAMALDLSLDRVAYLYRWKDEESMGWSGKLPAAVVQLRQTQTAFRAALALHVETYRDAHRRIFVGELDHKCGLSGCDKCYPPEEKPCS